MLMKLFESLSQILKTSNTNLYLFIYFNPMVSHSENYQKRTGCTLKKVTLCDLYTTFLEDNFLYHYLKVIQIF